MAIILSVLVAALFLSLLISVLGLWGAAKLVRAAHPTIGRAVLATVVLSVISILYIPASQWLRIQTAGDTDVTARIGREAILGLLFLLATWVVIMRTFGTSFGRALLMWLINLIPGFILVLGVLLPLKLFVADAYTVPTNGMAPTIVGYHREAECPRCGGTLILTAPEPGNLNPMAMDEERPGICVSCRKTSVRHGAAKVVHPPDRILVNRLLAPERWDVVLFRSPEVPGQKWVKRLVGLPGEKVYIKDDFLWINDVKQDVPAEVSGLEYASEMGFGVQLKGMEAEPVVLGADEYFVLGDFSKSSHDSRFWGPLPRSEVEGVVCARYWPPARWKVFR